MKTLNAPSLADVKSMPQFEEYHALIKEWNEKFNLTTILERDEVYVKHFLDSLLPCSLIPLGANLLDVGSGAGFPGICLKIFRPDLKITLLDSVGKKVTFLQAVIDRLGLSGIVAVKSRIEEYKQRSFDVVTARAVASTATLAEYCLPFLRVGGMALLYKSDNIDGELDSARRAISTLGGGKVSVYGARLAGDIMRSFVVIEKTEKTPPQYPRAGNKPRLSPL